MHLMTLSNNRHCRRLNIKLLPVGLFGLYEDRKQGSCRQLFALDRRWLQALVGNVASQ